MPYDENFYRMYQEYLREKIVRQNHNRVFEILAQFSAPIAPRVIDLGCGIGEYPTFDPRYVLYAGIDMNEAARIPNFSEGTLFLMADYMNLEFADRLPFQPNAFISLFSIECCHPVAVRYALYEKLFARFPSLRCGLVGGFFYESKRDQETVSENGGIVSYQTIEDPSHHISEMFLELRMHMRTPSKMFGNDVIEVWKFLIRK